jgi:hypothetical protein
MKESDMRIEYVLRERIMACTWFTTYGGQFKKKERKKTETERKNEDTERDIK